MSNAVWLRLPWLALCLITVLVTQMPAQTARTELNSGVMAYKQGKYDEAIDHFQNAVSLDPSLLNAHLYLAAAFSQKFIPGVDTAENNTTAAKAIEQYREVLNADPKNISSVKGIAYLYMQMKNFEDSKEYYRKAVELNPNDPESYYSVAIIDWSQSYRARMQERAKLGIKPEEPLEDNNACAALKAANTSVIEDGIAALDKALQLRPDYDEAMAYMNLLYREKADLQCENPEARAADLKTADEWVDKTMATKKAKSERLKAGQE